jgi:predicted SprT family Zn-dependent metalloprotease
MEECGSMTDFDFSEASETVLTYTLRCLERKYFPSNSPTKTLVLGEKVTSVGCYLPQLDTIVINPRVAPIGKMSQIPILHELVHRNLFLRDGDADEAHGDEFQKGIRQLFDDNAYRNLL